VSSRFALALVLALAWLGISVHSPAVARAERSGPADVAPAATEPRAPALEVSADGSAYLLSADFAVPLTRALEDAVSRGLPLYFTVDFELRKRRWWWLDELIVERSATWRLSHHALTRQFRLAGNDRVDAYESLDQALVALSRLRDWRVLDPGDVEPGETYRGQVRLRLDTSQLPKPFQITGLSNRDWNPQAEWKRFVFTVPMPKSAQ
jgi:hypothetical protein